MARRLIFGLLSSDGPDGVNEEPALVVYMENSEPEQQVVTSEALHAIASALSGQVLT